MTENPPAPLVFLHIPRTAGSSLYEMLAARFESEQVYPWSHSFGGLSRAHLDTYRFFGGHYSGSDLDAHLGARTEITVVRRPQARLRSLYTYWRAHTPEAIARSGDRYMLSAHELDFEDFLRSEDPTVMLSVRNGMTALLGRADYNGNYREVTEEEYRNACARLERMPFVGLHEFFGESLAMLWRMLRASPAGEPPRIGSAEDRAVRPEFREVATPAMSSAAADCIDALNEFDDRLYEHASELFAARRRAPPEVSLPLPSFRRGSLFRNARVAFGRGEAGNDLLGAGWSHPEDGFVWSDGEAAEIVFRLPKAVPAGTTLSLELRPYVKPRRHPSLLATFRLGGTALRHVVFVANDSRASIEPPGQEMLVAAGERPHAVSLMLPEMQRGEHVLQLDLQVPASPAELEESTDERRLGVALSWLELG